VAGVEPLLQTWGDDITVTAGRREAGTGAGQAGAFAGTLGVVVGDEQGPQPVLVAGSQVMNLRTGLRHLMVIAVALAWGLVRPTTAPPSTAWAQSTTVLDPGTWRAELGDFRRLVGAVAFAADDVWAVGDGIVHYDGGAWKQVISGYRPFFRAIDGPAPDQIWAAGELAAVLLREEALGNAHEQIAVERHDPGQDGQHQPRKPPARMSPCTASTW
jgi:hypothetical protein